MRIFFIPDPPRRLPWILSLSLLLTCGVCVQGQDGRLDLAADPAAPDAETAPAPASPLEKAGIIQHSLDVDVLEIEVPPAIVEHIEQSPPLLVHDGLLAEKRQEELSEVLRLLHQDYDLRMYVHILPSTLYREIYPQRAIAVEKVKLLSSYGGIMVLTDVPGERLVNFSNLLITRLGEENLRQVIREADEAADLAVGHEARIGSYVTELLTQLTIRMKAEVPNSESSAVAIFDILSRGGMEELITARRAQESTAEVAATQGSADETSPEPVPAAATENTSETPVSVEPVPIVSEPGETSSGSSSQGFLAGLALGLLGMIGLALFMNRRKLTGGRGRSRGSRRSDREETGGDAEPVQVRPAKLNKEKEKEQQIKTEEARDKLAALLEAERAREEAAPASEPEGGGNGTETPRSHGEDHEVKS